MDSESERQELVLPTYKKRNRKKKKRCLEFFKSQHSLDPPFHINVSVLTLVYDEKIS